MKPRQLLEMGVPRGRCLDVLVSALPEARRAGMAPAAIRAAVEGILADPASHTGHALFGDFAKAVMANEKAQARYVDRETPAPYGVWGSGFDRAALDQIDNACKLPVSVAGALMPDAHVGYGLPIGGVLATRNSVIPYAVGVDIACRMKMTVLDLPPDALEKQEDRLARALERETVFGVGGTLRPRAEHRVMDEDWSFTPVVRALKDKAWSQLGTSGSGNHFVEFGTLTLPRPDLGLEAGTHLALLSHSGSRGTGAQIADYYSKLAMRKRPELPRELQHLAWLDLDTDEGQDYWWAMELMGRYAAANHELIHRRVARHLGVDVKLDLENHHNFAWRERHHGEEVVVHRKGATPAGRGVLGIIPGSMGTPGYVVRGKGDPASLDSASHGAGRRMSRKQAIREFTWEEARRFLEERRVRLLSAGLDEVPMAYKDIEEVMAAQDDLVERVAQFRPRLVKMAPAGERPED